MARNTIGAEDAPEIGNAADNVRDDESGRVIVELTDYGILDHQAPYGREDVVDAHGEPVYEDGDVVIFEDSSGEFGDWAEYLDIEFDEWSQWMHDLARELGDRDDWPATYPLVYDQRTFDA